MGIKSGAIALRLGAIASMQGVFSWAPTYVFCQAMLLPT